MPILAVFFACNGLLTFLLTRFFLFVCNFTIWPYVERKENKEKNTMWMDCLSRAVQLQLVYSSQEFTFATRAFSIVILWIISVIIYAIITIKLVNNWHNR